MRLAHLSVRLLLLLCPRRFRSEFAPEMLDVFEDRFGDIALRCHSSTHRSIALSKLRLSTWANIDFPNVEPPRLPGDESVLRSSHWLRRIL